MEVTNGIYLINLPKEELKEFINECISFSISQSGLSRQAENTLLTRKDISRLFRVSLVTINTWMKEGKLPYHRINSRIYFKENEIKESLEKYKISSGQK